MEPPRPTAGRSAPPALDTHASHDGLREAAERIGLTAAELEAPTVQQAVLEELTQAVPALADLIRQAGEQLDVHGAVRFTGLPVASDVALIGLLTAFGQPTSRGNGAPAECLVYEVAPDDAATGPTNLSKGRAAQKPHTDSPVQHRPHEFLALACVTGDPAGGGLSTVVRADDVAAALDEHDGGATTALLREETFLFLDTPLGLDEPPVIAPVLRRTSEGQWRVRFRHDALVAGFQRHPDVASDAHREAVDAFTTMATDPALTAIFQLVPGDMVLLDNTRVMHGRTEITGTAERRLKRIKLFGQGTAA
ncbi:TauD/TfdA family dioxygenase [Streptomyces sp. 110]|uniref:TauD/TfdA family dioxygenase n=1 Tax=Streptomyces endocoffeicus TaxID=2898945 RepID=A0ABS1Q1C6_9ACTN|nr:TauD/TfdA family dioxygenase [Streptomyces endocoffeicus]MBL1118170.1 TauD/TfdA family dioxygenase [Streptomyces endocoffeicus]